MSTTPNGLLNATSTPDTLVEYDRSYGGAFNNPYGGAPNLTFFMHRVVTKQSDGTLLSSSALPSVVEPYTAGKVYQIFDPSTGLAVPDNVVSAEMVYAIIYSVMRAAAGGLDGIPVTPDGPVSPSGSPSPASPSSP